MRKSMVVGNWKLHGSRERIADWLRSLIQRLDHTENCEIAVAPPLLYLDRLANLLEEVGRRDINLVAQNVDVHLSGAYTGEISAEMLKDVGVSYVMVGHSERRILHGESEVLMLRKLEAVQKVGLRPVLCVGDSLAERRRGLTAQVCCRQIEEVVESLGVEILERMTVAYEPLWAVGAHSAASPQIVQEVHACIRGCISRFSQKLSQQFSICYGGSVNSGSVETLTAQPDVNGFLLGRSSLDPAEFAVIIGLVARKAGGKAVDL